MNAKHFHPILLTWVSILKNQGNHPWMLARWFAGGVFKAICTPLERALLPLGSYINNQTFQNCGRSQIILCVFFHVTSEYHHLNFLG